MKQSIKVNSDIVAHYCLYTYENKIFQWNQSQKLMRYSIKRKTQIREYGGYYRLKQVADILSL